MSVRKTPTGASIAEPLQGAKLFAPAAERNRDVIAALIASIAPKSGTALEIASGTGQHVPAFAKACPNLIWQPTDVSDDRLQSIDAYAADAGCDNILPAQILDATEAGWAAARAPSNFVFLSNLLHLISTSEAKRLLSEVAQTLCDDGQFLVYGPFMRDGQLTSKGDVAFHAQLTAQDPEIGYKDTSDVIQWAAQVGLKQVALHEMPANNLAIEFKVAL